ncbi:MAG: hypothetical protein Q9197_006142 [Variospora fuerteventurae]
MMRNEISYQFIGFSATRPKSLVQIHVFINHRVLGNPAPPPGFRVDPLCWDASIHQYDAREIWFNIVAVASLLALFNSNQLVQVTQQYRSMVSGHIIYVIPTPQMTDGMLVWFFWELGKQIAQRYPMPHMVPQFWGEFNAAPGMRASFLISEPRQAAPELTGASINASDIEAVSAIRHRRRAAVLETPAVLEADRGSRRCVDDPNLVIHYQFYRHTLPPGQVFTAFLTAQTFFSEHDEEGRQVEMLALSMDSRVRLSVSGLNTGPGRNGLTWGLAREGLRTVWRDLVMGFSISAKAFVGEARWESVSFTYEYHGVEIGRGTLGW